MYVLLVGNSSILVSLPTLPLPLRRIHLRLPRQEEAVAAAAVADSILGVGLAWKTEIEPWPV